MGFLLVNGRLLGLFVGPLVLPWSTPVLGWSDVGHRIICEIAFQEMEPTARERVKAMIRQDPEFDTFAESCSWPDRPRRRAVEHYVNLPRDAEGFAKDPCPVADKCVVSAIEKDLAVLSSPGAREQEKLEALKYLGHWVGDVHQPRPWRQQHRGIRRSLQLGSACGLGRLPHRERCPGGCVRCRDLLDDVTDEDRATWRASTPTDWANESFAISVSPEVRYCVRTEAGCSYEADNERLDDGEPERTVVVDQSYIETHRLTVRDQLVRAGVRLGGLLNRVLGD